MESKDDWFVIVCISLSGSPQSRFMIEWVSEDWMTGDAEDSLTSESENAHIFHSREEVDGVMEELGESPKFCVVQLTQFNYPESSKSPESTPIASLS